MIPGSRLVTGGAAVRPLRPVTFGLAGLLGALLFATALAVLHLVRTDVDWTRRYVSDFANGRLGWVFVAAAVTHGFGNLALDLGLRRSLDRSLLSTGAVVLFGLASAGIVVAALFPIDPSGQSATLAGFVHRAVATASFPLELVALFLFSAAFAGEPRWRGCRKPSFALATITAAALAGFLLAVVLNRMPGLAERLALASFLAWELWAAGQLVWGEAGAVNRFRKLAVTVVGSLALLAGILLLLAVVAALFAFFT